MASVWSTEASSNIDSAVTWNPVMAGAAMSSGGNKVADIPSSLEPTQFPLGFTFCCFRIKKKHMIATLPLAKSETK